ncbi:MAG: SusC/RagA family TonB-linked outer membrane protein, partial [Paludibacter sp.]|nr:SusC/RagA family TonB-linked outer membrane protein [Paludibacter sp.]
MKRTKFCIKLRIVPFVAMLFACIAVSAQQISVSGAVTDASGAPVAGATVVEAGTANATMTDGDGGYKISVPRNGRLVFSCVGFSQQTINVNGQSVINVTMEEDETTRLREVVAIGYGTIKKSDATGAVEVLTSKDMNKGPIVTADNLITGRMPGVQVIPNGNPGTGSTIRIRGGASLDANNDPLIVVDGLPLSNASITQINPNDIESFSVLKDASAAAIYGSRASNGVILITTKKGGEGKWKFNFDAQGSVMTLPWKVKTLSQQDFIDAVTNLGQASADKLGYNGVMYNTDWQDQIFGTQAGTSTNFSALGKIGNFMPARITVGYNNTPGLLLTTGYQRTNASVALSPSFFNNTLKIEVNANGSYERYNRADDEGGVIGGAIYFDPTKPVFVNGARDENAKYFGYYEWGADYDPANPNYPINTLASRNPVAMLREVDRHSDVYKLWGNVQAEYSFPFAKGLKAVVNVGLQKERWFEDMMASKYANTIHRVNAIDMPIGSEWHNRGENTNKLLDAYLNYNNTFGAFHLDLTGGYSYQKYQIGTEHNSGDQQMLANGLITEEAVQLNMNRIYTPRCMISFFGRANFSLLERYLLTLTVRNDRSSMFAPDKRSGIFPAASFAWRITEEGFLKDSQAVSNLKLRLGWGITGQQGLFIGDNYNINRYLPLYGSSQDSHSQYPIGNTYYYPVYPMAYDP